MATRLEFRRVLFRSSPSITVNIASVWFGRPDSRTTRTASATASLTPSPVPIGLTENATRTDIVPTSSQHELGEIRATHRRPVFRLRPGTEVVDIPDGGCALRELVRMQRITR